MPVDHVILGSGAIGRAVAEELLHRGESVRVVNRSGGMEETPGGAEVVATDLYDPARVREVAGGAKVVYQCAQPNYFEWPQKFPPLQKSIIDGLTGSGARLVLVENLYMYGETHGKPMTEEMPYNAHTVKGKVRAEMSRSAFAAHREGKVRVTAARGSDFFGPWGLPSSMGERAIYPLLHGKTAQMVGRLDLPHTHTYIPDFAKALVTLGARPEADGQAWHVPNDMPEITQGDMIRMIAKEAGVEPKMNGMGRGMMWIGGLFIPEAKESLEMMYEFEQSFVVDSSRYEKAFNQKATPMREAVKQTVAWFKNHPERK
jgi:nucleoside-diphosphate-sugar epimerase